MRRLSRAAGALFLVGWLERPAQARWLEVGCGTGAFTGLACERRRPGAIRDQFGAHLGKWRGGSAFPLAGADEVTIGGRHGVGDGLAVREVRRIGGKAHSGQLRRHATTYLHDVLEDTDTTIDELIEAFGPGIAEIVADLTNVYTKAAYPKLNRARRKRLETERLAHISPRGQNHQAGRHC
jgi:hypothetical protein